MQSVLSRAPPCILGRSGRRPCCALGPPRCCCIIIINGPGSSADTMIHAFKVEDSLMVQAEFWYRLRAIRNHRHSSAAAMLLPALSRTALLAACSHMPLLSDSLLDVQLYYSPASTTMSLAGTMQGRHRRHP